MNRNASLPAACRASDISLAPALMLAGLRITIGWHFLYEGVAKWMQPDWSAGGYLEASRWLLADLYHWMASNAAVLKVVNLLNIWGLILIGVALILGGLTRLAALAGIALLLLYWLANPPLVGLGLAMPAEGHYLVINKNVVEMLALAVVAVMSAGQCFGLDRLLQNLISARRRAPAGKATGATPAPTAAETVPPAQPAEEFPEVSARREVLKSLIGVPVLAGFAGAVACERRWRSYEEKNLADAAAAPSAKMLDATSLAEKLQGQLPLARVGDKQRSALFSRVILGGNLLNGNAHARDLLYVSSLVKAYHTKDKIFQTLLLAEKCGINTLLTNPVLCTLINEYWKRKIGKIQFISDCFGLQYDKWPNVYMMDFGPFLDKVKRAIDYGACACYVQGETADWFVEHKQVDKIATTLELIRRNGLPAGIGAHGVETVRRCVEAGMVPDFWMKTLHHHKYWSARHAETNATSDNVFCPNPEETIEFMQGRTEPWVAFKVLAAGAIRPKDAFEYAYRNGADFLCVGMYDFQIVDDVNIALAAFDAARSRPRPWFGKQVSV